MDNRILSFLQRNPGSTYSALQIAKAVGQVKGSDVNAALYRLMKSGKLHKSDDSRPLWALHTEKMDDMPTPESVKKQIPTEEQAVMEMLKKSDSITGITAREIAKKLNQERKSVNKTLHELKKTGKVEKLDDTFWKLSVCGKDDSADSDFAEDPGDITQSGLSISRDFHIVKELGEGGFGCVCLVKHKLDGRSYAMKIVKYNRDAEREVRALAKCEHPNIVRYFTAWRGEFDRKAVGLGSTSEQSKSYDLSSSEDEDSELKSGSEADSSLQSKSGGINFRQDKLPWLFIQMEFCENGTLRTWIENSNFGKLQKSREDALQVFQQVVCGVEYIHSKGLIHRDLKPDNILFANDCAIKIGDFGLVTSITNQNGAIMKRTVGTGTLPYMSPEQGEQREYNEKTDIFPLGLICFELLWKISTSSERVKIWPDLRNQVFPCGFCEAYTGERKLISRMLSKSPENRPDATEIAKFIKDFLLRDKVLNQKTV